MLIKLKFNSLNRLVQKDWFNSCRAWKHGSWCNVCVRTRIKAVKWHLPAIIYERKRTIDPMERIIDTGWKCCWLWWWWWWEHRRWESFSLHKRNILVWQSVDHQNTLMLRLTWILCWAFAVSVDLINANQNVLLNEWQLRYLNPI